MAVLLSNYNINDRGVVAIFVALALVVFIGISALAVDLGYLYVGRTELQKGADAAALAATRKLGDIYDNMDPSLIKNYIVSTEAVDLIKGIATDVASKNSAARQSINLSSEDVIIGIWRPANLSKTPPEDPFTSTLNQPDAVRVIAKRDGSSDSRITIFFARIFGINDVAVTANATAALTGPPSVPVSDLPLPFAMGTGWPARAGQSNWCSGNIITYPTSQCVGWHTYMTTPTGKKIIDGILDKLLALQSPIPSPIEEVKTGDVFEGFGGNWDINTCNKLRDLFNMMKVQNDGKWDKDTSSATWTTSVVIYEDDDCGWNPNKPFNIVGFTPITISDIKCPGPELIAKAVCDVDLGRSGGSTFGRKNSIPGLVK